MNWSHPKILIPTLAVVAGVAVIGMIVLWIALLMAMPD